MEEKNAEDKLNLNKIVLFPSQKSNNRYSESEQKQSEKFLDFNKQTEENFIPEKHKIKLTKRLNSVVDVVKSENISYEDDNVSFPRRLVHKNKKQSGFKKIKSLVYDNRNRFKKLFKEEETGEKEEIEENNVVQEKKTLRQTFVEIFTNEKLEIIQLIISIICTINSIFYIICTYKIWLFKYMNYFDIFIFIYLALYNFIEIVLSNDRLIYIFSFNFYVQVITMLPVFLCFLTDDYLSSYIYQAVNCCRVLRFYLITINMNYFKFGTDNKITKQILEIIYFLLNIAFIVSGLMQIVERTEIEKLLKIQINPLSQLELRLSRYFHHYLYFTIITLSTVGYGDICPHTIIGKIIFDILAFIILVVIPYQLNDLFDLILSQSVYAKNSYIAKEGIPHILLVGNISTESLKSFCKEFFHPDHGSQYRHVVILNKSIPPRDMEIFLEKSEIKNYVFYLQGDSIKKEDLLRAEAHKSKACIIFNDKNSKYPIYGDRQCIFIGAYIKKFVYNYNHDLAQKDLTLKSLIDYSSSSFRLCMQLNKSNSISNFNKFFQPIYKKVMNKDQLIIMENLKMNILSKSCMTPGIMTLVSNLIMTSGDVEEKIEEKWVKEYSDGRGHEIYRIQLKEYYHQFSFIEIVRNIYDQGQVICFALEIEVDGVTILKLNPGIYSNLKIKDIIEKGKKFNFKNDLFESQDICEKKDFANTLNLNCKSEIMTSVKKVNKNYRDTHKDNNVKIFAYLICADKSMADDVTNNENIIEKDLSKSIDNTEEIKVEKNNPINKEKLRTPKSKNNIRATERINITENFPTRKLTTIVRNNDNNNTRGLFKELMKNVSNNLNTQVAMMDKDSSDENEEYIDDKNIFQFATFSLEVNIHDYYIYKDKKNIKKNSENLCQESIEHREDISNHIIICGFHHALLHFILPLRARYIEEEDLKWIIILSPIIPEDLLQDLVLFNRIIYIRGSPSSTNDLFRANVIKAEKAVILSNGDSKIESNIKSKNPESDNKYDESSLDDETIIIYKLLKKCNKNIKIITELISTSNIEYLLNIDNLQQLSSQKGIFSEYEYTKLYASGEIYTPKIIDCLTCQSYYNPHIVNIIELLLGGQTNYIDKKVKKLDDYYNLKNSNLYLIKIPDSHINQAFMDYYYYLLSYNTIALGIYRKCDTDEFYYVYTNPEKTILLRENDYVFILSNNESINELKEGSYSNDEDNIIYPSDNAPIKKKKELNLSNSFDSSDDEEEGKEIVKEIKTKKESSRIINKTARNMSYRFSESHAILDRTNYENSKFNKIRERYDNVQKDLENIKKEFGKIPQYIYSVVDEVIENEINSFMIKRK